MPPTLKWYHCSTVWNVFYQTIWLAENLSQPSFTRNIQKLSKTGFQSQSCFWLSNKHFRQNWIWRWKGICGISKWFNNNLLTFQFSVLHVDLLQLPKLSGKNTLWWALCNITCVWPVKFRSTGASALTDQSSLSIDWLQSLKQFFMNVSYHILVASLTLMALF